MTKDEVWDNFQVLWSDIKQSHNHPSNAPLLAHYTSIDTLEKIISNNEIWFSNPLYLNDYEELRSGISDGVNAFRNHKGIRDACGSEERYQKLSEAFENYFEQFSNKHVLDTYVFCLAEHKSENKEDGLLSMWRGYGGNGRGAALVFDLKKLEYIQDSPLILSKVSYFSREERINWLDGKLNEFARQLTTEIPVDMLYLPAGTLFERLKIFALFTKHHGFYEEQEWRVVYLIDRDKHKFLERMLDYTVGRYGIEPKLKLKIQPIEGLSTVKDLSIEKIATKIILGPVDSSQLAINSVRRMLELLGKYELAEGGYNLKALGGSVAAHVGVLMVEKI